MQQPTVSWKNALQEGRPITFNPLVLYRGVWINAATIMPITCSQFAVSRALELQILKDGATNLTDAQKIGCAAMGGCASSLFSCPAELTILQQQKTGDTLGTTLRRITSQYGVTSLYRSIGCTAIREGVYSVGYLGVCPIIQSRLAEVEALKDKPYTTWILGAFSAGLMGAVCSHPFDTIKTRMQGNLETSTSNEYRHFSGAARAVYNEGQMFAGMVPRGLRILGATIILSTFKEQAGGWLERSREQSSSE